MLFDYMKTKKTIRILNANLLSLLMLPILAIPFYCYNRLWGLPSIYNYIYPLTNVVYASIILLVSISLHELIHAFFFAVYAKNKWKNVKIGFIWKYFTPYAHCSEPLKILHYRIALLMPGLLLGIIPLLTGLIFGIYYLLVFGAIFTLSAGGDIIIYILTLNYSKNKMLLDHPTECGFYVIDQKDYV